MISATVVCLLHNAECLSLEWFRSRAEAKVVIETWRKHFNEVRPHSSLGYLKRAAIRALFVASRPEECQDAASVPAMGPDRCGMRSLHAPPPRINRAQKGQSNNSTQVTCPLETGPI